MGYLDECKEQMNKSITSCQESLATLRAGRVTAQLLDKVYVKVYEENMILKSVAGISNLSATDLQIKPYDPTTIKDIIGGLNKADLGCTVTQNGNAIVLKFPTPSEERRQDLIKQAKKYAEDYKVTIRNIRKDINNKVKKDETLSEDASFSLLDDIQKETDKRVSEIDVLLENKIKDIETI